MGVFQNRPFAAGTALSLFLSLGLCAVFFSKYAQSAVPLLRGILFTVVCLLLLFAVFFLSVAFRAGKWRMRFCSAALTLVLLLVIVLRVGGYFSRYAEAGAFVGEAISTVVTIEECETATVGYTRYRVRMESVKYCGTEMGEIDFGAILVIERTAEYQRGDRLLVEAEAVSLSEIYDSTAYAITNGAFIGLMPLDETEEVEGEASGNAATTEDAERVDDADSAKTGELSVTVLSRPEDADGFVWEYVRDWFSCLRSRLSFVFREEIGGDAGALAAAVLLGDRSGLDSAVTRDFSRAGISHLLAISGLHMSILIGGFAWFLRKIGLSRRATSVSTLLLLFFFLLLTDFPLSACRAGGMLAFAAVAGFFSRKSDPLTALCAAAYFIVAVSPASLLDVGFWMSVSSVFALLVFSPKWESYYRERLRRRADGRCHAVGISFFRKLLFRAVSSLPLWVGVSLIASFAVFPLLWLSGGEFPIYGLLANLLTTFLMPVLLALSVLFLALCRANGVGALLCLILRWIGRFFCSVASFVSSLPSAAVSLRYPFAGVSVLIFAVSTMLFLIFPEKTVRCLREKCFPKRYSVGSDRFDCTRFCVRGILQSLLSAILVYGVCFFLCTAYRSTIPLPVTVVSASGGEMLVLSRGGSGVLVDLADGAYADYRSVTTVGDTEGVTEWEAVVLTHYHMKQITSVTRFCRKNFVRSVLLPAPETENDHAIFRSITARLDQYGILYQVYARGEAQSVGGVMLTLSESVYLNRSTQPIFSLSLTSDGEKLTYFTQAIEESALSENAEKDAADSTYLLYGSDGPKRKDIYRIPVDGASLRWVLTYGEENKIYLSPISRRALENGNAIGWTADREAVRLWALAAGKE